MVEAEAEAASARGGGGGGAGAAGTGFRRSVSTPETGPRQVVPEYGSRSASLLSIVPVDDSENVQFPNAGSTAAPLTVTCTVEPLRSPRAVPLNVIEPRHVAVKSPEMAFADWLVTNHSNLLQPVPVVGRPGGNTAVVEAPAVQTPSIESGGRRDDGRLARRRQARAVLELAGRRADCQGQDNEQAAGRHFSCSPIGRPNTTSGWSSGPSFWANFVPRA